MLPYLTKHFGYKTGQPTCIGIANRTVNHVMLSTLQPITEKILPLK